MRSIVRHGALLAGSALLLAGCGGSGKERAHGPATRPAPVAATAGVADTPVILGAPFRIGAVSYAPADIPDYDDVGYAGWIGEEAAGRPTANGEPFHPAAISAAHKTLPLPSYVEVTALDTGRTILVRVNDRGPMVNDRLIDLSRGAAEQLGIDGRGVAAVRVRRTNPPAAERAQLRAGRAVPERLATPDSLLVILRNKMRALPVPANAPPPVARPGPKRPAPAPRGDDRFVVERPGAAPAPKPAPAARPAPAAEGYIVQVGAFGSEARARDIAKKAGGTVSRAGNVWRVRIGPFARESDAQAALAQARTKGFRDAVVLRDR